VSLRPVAILVVKGDDVQLYDLGRKGFMDRIAELIPEALSKVKNAKSRSTEECSEEKKEGKE